MENDNRMARSGSLADIWSSGMADPTARSSRIVAVYKFSVNTGGVSSRSVTRRVEIAGIISPLVKSVMRAIMV